VNLKTFNIYYYNILHTTFSKQLTNFKIIKLISVYLKCEEEQRNRLPILISMYLIIQISLNNLMGNGMGGICRKRGQLPSPRKYIEGKLIIRNETVNCD